MTNVTNDYGGTIEFGVNIPLNWKVVRNAQGRITAFKRPDGAILQPWLTWAIESGGGEESELNYFELEDMGVSYDYRDRFLVDETER